MRSVHRVKVYRGTVRHKDLVGVIGLVAGAIVGGVIGANRANGSPVQPECREHGCDAYPSREELALDGAKTGGLIGISVGALIGF